MALTTQKYVHRPVFVDGVQVTAENMDEICAWTDGKVHEIDGRRYVKVDVIRSNRAKETQAFVGDWVLKGHQGFKIYTDRAFKRSFCTVPSDVPTSDPKAVKLLEEVFSR